MAAFISGRRNHDAVLTGLATQVEKVKTKSFHHAKINYIVAEFAIVAFCYHFSLDN